MGGVNRQPTHTQERHATHEKLSFTPSNNFNITKKCFKLQNSSQIVSRLNSCIRKNEKRSDQNVLPNELNLTIPFGFDMPKKRFSVLIQILNIVHSDRKPFGIVLTKIATDTGNFTVH